MMSELTNLKQELISISQASDIGFNYIPKAKEQIETLAASVEALNPTPEPTNKIDLVQGRWQLLYSTFGLERETTLQRLSFGKLPNVKVNVTGIFQEVNTVDKKYNNLIEFTAASDVQGITLVSGRYTVENSQRLNIDFWETSVNSASKDLSESDFREALGVDNDSPLKSTLSFSGWSDITYLDENFRLMRGNQQNLYVLLRND
ncbi:fibrillin [Nostocales cyanobacterium LEGE 11386]|nr:fibrillin [Nostocales cyanobacterium LEGE 11386]